MFAEYHKENTTLEVRLSNVGLEKPASVTSVTESGRLMAHVASMERRATMANAKSFPPIAQEVGDLDGDIESIETDHQAEDQYVPGSQEIHSSRRHKNESKRLILPQGGETQSVY